jgi:hypothetical protein
MVRKIKHKKLTALFSALVMVAGLVTVALASDVDCAVVDTTAPTGSVTLAPGDSAPITINLTVTGNQDGTATFKVYRNWTLSGGTFTGSDPETFTVTPRTARDPANTFSTSGTVTVAAGQADGTFTLEVGAFDITNSNQTGAKLSARYSSNYQVTVATPTPSDDTPPSTEISLSGTLGNNDWYTSDVEVTLTATDNDGGSGVKEIRYSLNSGTEVVVTGASATFTVCAEGINSLSYYAVDNAENEETAKSATIKIDKTKPIITINVPADGAVYLLNQVVNADWSAEDSVSGIASASGTVASGSPIDTASVGSKTFTVNAEDNAGNTQLASVSYTVIYDFTGFFQPVDNLPTYNAVKAGSAVPVKFSLNGDQGLNIFAVGFPKSVQIANDVTAPVELIGATETVTAGNSSLSYDVEEDQYVYVWKTDKAWAGTCRQLQVKLNDGTIHVANFKLLK